MPDTIAVESSTIAPCAVFKISLKGRFVYLDDRVEKLLGIKREELFGRYLFEFISDPSRHVLDHVIDRHNRYESFYQSVPLTLRSQDGQLHNFSSVVTLNFIGGSPVNYQFILIPCTETTVSALPGLERRFLEILDQELEAVSLDEVAELFCRVGGYREGQCYLPDHRDNYLTAGSYPVRETGIAGPAYIALFSLEPTERYSHNPEDCELHAAFGNRRSEAVFFLDYKTEDKLAVWVQAPEDYRPTPEQMDGLRLMVSQWNRRFGFAAGRLTVNQQLSALGRSGDILGLSIAVVDESRQVIFANRHFFDLFGEKKNGKPPALEQILKGWLWQAPAGVDEISRFFAYIRQRPAPGIGLIHNTGSFDTRLIAAAPWERAGGQWWALAFLPMTMVNKPGGRDTRLLASVVNGLQAPAKTIAAFVDRIALSDQVAQSEDVRFAIDCLKENVSTLRQMIERLNRYTESISEVAAELLPVDSLVRGLIEQLKAAYGQTTFSVTIADPLPELYVSKEKLNQLFRNILDNAFKFSAGAGEPHIQVRCRREEKQYCFTISDNGRGIAERHREKIFDLFFREPEVAELPGIGIGLAIAREIVISLGGRIWCETGKRPGLAIIFTIPAESADGNRGQADNHHGPA